MSVRWEQLPKRLGFKTEHQMWVVLQTSLRTDKAIAAYLEVSTGAVRRRRKKFHLQAKPRMKLKHKTAHTRMKLEKLPPSVWVEKQIQEIAEMVGCSPGYVSKVKRKLGF